MRLRIANLDNSPTQSPIKMILSMGSNSYSAAQGTWRAACMGVVGSR
jgi:hypothetical protein